MNQYIVFYRRNQKKLNLSMILLKKFLIEMNLIMRIRIKQN
jgi:hypothetical protein